MRFSVCLAALLLSFTIAKAEYLVPQIHRDRFLGKSFTVHKLNFESATVDGRDRDCLELCVIWVLEDSVQIAGDRLFIGHTIDRNQDIPIRMRFGDEILSMTCKLTQGGSNCIPSSKTLSGAELAKKFRNFVGSFAVEFLQEMPGKSSYRRDVWATKIVGIAPKKDPRADEIDYSGLHESEAKK